MGKLGYWSRSFGIGGLKMVEIQFKAEWDAEKQKIAVWMKTPENRFIEYFSREEWDDYIQNLDNRPFKFAGVSLSIKGIDKDKVTDDLKAYLRKVAFAFKSTNSTEYIGNDTGQHWKNIRKPK